MANLKKTFCEAKEMTLFLNVLSILKLDAEYLLELLL